MRKTLLAVLVLALVGGGIAVAASASGDQALAKDPARADCPGRIECPLTGELICADECPLANADAKDAALPPCCQDKK